MVAVLENIATRKDQLAVLSSMPLSGVRNFVIEKKRAELGMPLIDSTLSFDVTNHDAANTVVAKSVLSRISDDVKAFADYANNTFLQKIIHLI
jgi:hypothetical protein